MQALIMGSIVPSRQILPCHDGWNTGNGLCNAVAGKWTTVSLNTFEIYLFIEIILQLGYG